MLLCFLLHFKNRASISHFLFCVAVVLEDLGVRSVETVILSVPEGMHSCEGLRGVWRALEDQVDAGKVYSLGISDLNMEELEQLYNSVRVTQLYPDHSV